MKSYTIYYSTLTQLQEFIKQNSIVNNERLLIQIYSGILEYKELKNLLRKLTHLLPLAHTIGATTDGEIASGKVTTNKIVLSFTQFEKTSLKSVMVKATEDNFDTGARLAKSLESEASKVIITFIEGLHSNADAYLQGIDSINSTVLVAGGMAGDNAQFKKTYVFLRNKISSNAAVGVALIGEDLKIYNSYNFNWMPLGKTMKITASEANRVYEIDGIRAYEMYKKYLGEDAAKLLPSVGIEFPLVLQKGDEYIARAVISKHEDGSLSFAGNLIQGEEVRFGYGDAKTILNQSKLTFQEMKKSAVESIFVYSCMARRRFMPELIEVEVLPFQELGEVAGFFTYGEFFTSKTNKMLLNQTMTILGLSESEQILHNFSVDKYEEEELNDYQKSIKALTHLLNITTRELAEENKELCDSKLQLEISKNSLKHAQELSQIGSWEIDLDTNRSYWSAENYKIYGLDMEESPLSLEIFLEMIHEEDRPRVAQAIHKLSDESTKNLEAHFQKRDGEIVHVLIALQAMLDSNNKPIKIMGTTQDITAQIKFREQNEELAHIIENSSNEVYIVDKENCKYLYANQEALSKLGFNLNELVAKRLSDVNCELTQKKVEEFLEKHKDSKNFFIRTVHTKKDGTKYPVQSQMQKHKYNNKDVLVVVDMDITQMLEVELKERRQSQILEQIHDSVIVTDLEDIITHWNRGATLLHGYGSEEMIGKLELVLYPPEEQEKFYWMKEQVLKNGAYLGEIKKINKDNTLIYTEVSLSLFKDEEGNNIGIARYSQDITQKKLIEEKLQVQTEQLNYQAYYDALTDLPNRSLFEKRLQEIIVDSHLTNKEFALMFIDLDNFKQINDTLGHHHGDQVLKVVSRRLLGCIRDIDLLARLGGDEFTIIVSNINHPSQAERVAQSILESFDTIVTIENHELFISASIGISLYPKDSIFKSDLLKYSDIAMYHAKNEGRDNYKFYTSDMTRIAFEKARLEKYLHDAIKNKELLVYYQPQIDARNNSILGMEALVRWNHSEMGFVSPDKFIPLAEEIGLIQELDDFVMHQAMNDFASWYRLGYYPGILSLNLSIVQLKSEDFVERLSQTIKEAGFNPSWLELEISERQMMTNPAKSIGILQNINTMGISIAIDDLGTGYSSLAYLKKLPVHKLKIDKVFIQGLPLNNDDRAIVEAVIALAKSLHLKITAEGVETEGQREYLIANGCYNIQGYLYSKAISKEDMETFMLNNKIITLANRSTIAYKDI